MAAAIAANSVFSPITASAAVWSWGCAGPLGSDQIVFNRDRLVIVQSNTSPGKLDDLAQGGGSAIEALAKRKGVTVLSTYNPDDVNGGLDGKLSFTHETDKKKLVLTEVSSKKTGRSAKLLFGCRDETKERFTKTYRLEIAGEPPRTVTLQCMDYNLSTKGGRTCR